MADSPSAEQLTPLDLPMPRTYIRVLFTLETTQSLQLATDALQGGLDKLSSQLPWLRGDIVPTTSLKHARSLAIRSSRTRLSLTRKDAGEASSKALSAAGILPRDIPSEAWPVPGFIDDSLFEKGAPVFVASIFSMTDAAVGLCVCLYHNAVDATGFTEVMRLWAANMTENSFTFSGTPKGRAERLSGALSPALEKATHLSSEDILGQHPEYSLTPPAFPTRELPSCTSKLFRIPLHWINVLKDLMRKYTSNTLSTNTVLSAIIWTTISRVRLLRDPTLESTMSRLVTAVNGRQRIAQEFSTPEDPYFGNAVFYSLSPFSLSQLAAADETPVRCLAKICDLIAQSQSETVINSRHIAEIYHLIDSMEDYKSLFVGWDVFGSRDLTITSWADLALYDIDFGASFGCPKHVTLPYMEADGVVIVLPRQRASPEEVMEIMVMLREEDMRSLESDAMWKTLTSLAKVDSDLL